MHICFSCLFINIDEKCVCCMNYSAVNEDTDDAKVNADVTTADLVSSKDLASFAMQICRGMEHLANNKVRNLSLCFLFLL